MKHFNAIQFVSNVTISAADFFIETPIVLSCGADFGDAPDGSVDTDFSYPVRLVGNGGFHFIGGPFLGLFENDTDAEDDGQPTLGADGDDNEGVDDEQAVVAEGFQDRAQPITPSGVTPDVPLTCDGVSMSGIEGDFDGEALDLYCVTLEVANPTDRDAQVVGWIDFDGSGNWGNSGCATSANGLVTATCERSSARVYIGDLTAWGDAQGAPSACSITNPSLGQALGGSDWSTGNVPAGCEGHVVLVWDLSNFREQQDHFTTAESYARFRISTDTDTFLRENGPSPAGPAIDGEVEDWLIPEETLPVSISAFESRFIGNGLQVNWSTVSETRNAGFYIWGDKGEGPVLLHGDMVSSAASDAVTPHDYSLFIPGLREGDVRELSISAIDYNGKEKVYGTFEPGRSIGRSLPPATIDWRGIANETANRMRARGFERAGNRWHRPASAPGFGSAGGPFGGMALEPISAVDVLVSAPGMQRVTYEDLRAAGLDLAGVDPRRIAVTLQGKAVPRDILLATTLARPGRPDRPDQGGGPASSAALSGSGNAPGAAQGFGPGSTIDFWGVKPDFPDALYIDDYVYRITVDPGRAVDAMVLDMPVMSSAGHYNEVMRVNEENAYNFVNAAANPWYAARLRAGRSNDSHTTTFEVSADDARLLGREPARVEVAVSGLTAMPESPDHHVRLLVNGQSIKDAYFDGQVAKYLQAEVPHGVLQAGTNTVTVFLPGGTDALVDIVLVGSVSLHYPRTLQARNNRLLIEEVDARGGPSQGGLTVGGFTQPATATYAWSRERLIRLVPAGSPFGQQGSVRVPAVSDPQAHYWLSSEAAVQRPQVLGGVAETDLLAEAADFLIVAHPSFLPASPGDTHPLNTFIAERTAQGWNIGVYDITEIQTHYGGGMPLPQALTEFLRAADRAFAYSHVLLIGDDTYDYRDNLGLGSISFIPTRYAATKFIPHTPSDALLADLNGDGVSDKALGRWPVRTLADLEVTVAKTLDWADWPVADRQRAVWVTDTQDPNAPSFERQAERMITPLTAGGWPDTQVDRIFFDALPGSKSNQAAAARRQLFDALREGRRLTGFVGHGSPSMWTFQGLLTTEDIGELDNEGRPTLIGTLTCYTSYFASPYTDTVAHRLMNGYRVDDQGQPIPGAANGAVAVHGAATLSNYNQNEILARAVVEQQLQGKTLGEAIRIARQQAAARPGMSDQVTNWTLLGDPTLMLD